MLKSDSVNGEDKEMDNIKFNKYEEEFIDFQNTSFNIFEFYYSSMMCYLMVQIYLLFKISKFYEKKNKVEYVLISF